MTEATVQPKVKPKGVLHVVGDINVRLGIIQQFGETGSAMVTIASIFLSLVTTPGLTSQKQVIAIYTFTIVVWGPFQRQLQVAYGAITFILVFLAVFIGVTVGTQTHGTQDYMTPDGVSYSLPPFFTLIDYVVMTVLVLDWQRDPLQRRTLRWRIPVDVDYALRLSHHLYTIGPCSHGCPPSRFK